MDELTVQLVQHRHPRRVAVRLRHLPHVPPRLLRLVGLDERHDIGHQVGQPLRDHEPRRGVDVPSAVVRPVHVLTVVVHPVRAVTPQLVPVPVELLEQDRKDVYPDVLQGLLQHPYLRLLLGVPVVPPVEGPALLRVPVPEVEGPTAVPRVQVPVLRVPLAVEALSCEPKTDQWRLPVDALFSPRQSAAVSGVLTRPGVTRRLLWLPVSPSLNKFTRRSVTMSTLGYPKIEGPIPRKETTGPEGRRPGGRFGPVDEFLPSTFVIRRTGRAPVVVGVRFTSRSIRGTRGLYRQRFRHRTGPSASRFLKTHTTSYPSTPTSR